MQIYKFNQSNNFDDINSYTFKDFPISFNFFSSTFLVTLIDSSFKSIQDTDTDKQIMYTWSQAADLINLKIEPVLFNILPENDEISIKLDTVCLGNKKYILNHEIDHESSRWVWTNGNIVITLVKNSPGFWADLFTNDSNGLHEISIEEQQYSEEISQGLDKYTSDNNDQRSYFSSIYEERVPDSDDLNDFYANLYRLGHQNPVQEINLNTRKILFSSFDSTLNILKACFQLDIDGIVVNFSLSDEGNILSQHVATFNALAYVYMSKQDIRFTFCSDDNQLFVIVDTKGYAFFYENTNKPLNEFQRIEKFDDLPIGGYLLNKTLYLLTKNSIYIISCI
ncbi:hypothetical protein HZS_3049 [Henneguya salminicola]|uniref:NudC domain-containing protein 1 n=1 Tax=Henneguya salminicola TaxID=69463 RepID=A0A6G3MEN5_HENSL|nr:hypothetical protein HZS_3049 [Henneguya salminicola]